MAQSKFEQRVAELKMKRSMQLDWNGVRREFKLSDKEIEELNEAALRLTRVGLTAKQAFEAIVKAWRDYEETNSSRNALGDGEG